jgi:hypothetical protein
MEIIMSNISPAPVAPTSIYEFLDAIKFARGADPITERQRHALRNPPADYRLDPAEAEQDGYFSGRGRIDAKTYAAFVLKNHDARVAHIEAAIAALRDGIALPIERIERLGREIAPLREIPAALAAILDCSATVAPAAAADRFEAAAKKIAASAARNTRARII